MAWEKRGKNKYFYRSTRVDGRVVKVYHGAGLVGELAAGVDALRRAERKAEVDLRRQKKSELDAAVALSREFNEECNLLTTATLLVAGFHRPSRHSWRRWKDGRKEVRQA
jgi:hypothetical protein